VSVAQKRYHHQLAQNQESVRKNVLVLNFRESPKWLPGQIEKQLLYQVKMGD
jgi:hypothetical protein